MCCHYVADAAAAAAVAAAAVAVAAAAAAADFWCLLWQAYMHMVMLGIDLSRMKLNKSGSSLGADFPILREIPPTAGDAPAAAAAAAAATEASSGSRGLDQLHDLYILADLDVRRVAAVVATILIVQGHLADPLQHDAPHTASPKIILPRFEFGASEKNYTDALFRNRLWFVCSGRASLPSTVRGVACLPLSEWLSRRLLPLLVVLVLVVMIIGAAVATFGTSKGVFLVCISGLAQSAAVLILMAFLGRLPVGGGMRHHAGSSATVMGMPNSAGDGTVSSNNYHPPELSDAPGRRSSTIDIAVRDDQQQQQASSSSIPQAAPTDAQQDTHMFSEAVHKSFYRQRIVLADVAPRLLVLLFFVFFTISLALCMTCERGYVSLEGMFNKDINSTCMDANGTAVYHTLPGFYSPTFNDTQTCNTTG